LKTELKVGGRGQFAVELDGQVVIEKRSMAFPEDGEIVDALRQRLGKV